MLVVGSPLRVQGGEKFTDFSVDYSRLGRQSFAQNLRNLGNDLLDAANVLSLIGTSGAGVGLSLLAKTGVKTVITTAVVKAAKEESKYLYHYTSKEAAEAISQQGLKVGRDGFSYLTNKGGLSPLQAQIELALPANRALPNSILRIDASGLNPALIRRVSGNLPGYGAGGGTEFLFNQQIPANLIKVKK